jgi:soluble epoxide hydrolase / lipid-phosphate phosphatase
MEDLDRKTFTTSRSLTYNYYTSRSAGAKDPEKPALLFLHGFPTTAQLFNDIVPAFINSPHRILIPDLLGGGESSKPKDSALYAGSQMSKDIMEILDFEGIGQIIPIGHDFGSWFAQRIYLFNRSRCDALVMLSVAYMPANVGILAEHPSLDKFLEVTENAVGYAQYDYFKFFVSPEAPAIMKDHAGSLYTLIYADKKGAIREYYCEKDAFKDYLLADTKLPVKKFAQRPGMKEEFVSRFRNYGFEGHLNWYHSLVDGTQYESEKHFTLEDAVIKDPVLFIGCEDDAVARSDAINGAKEAGLLPDLTIKVLGCAHYCPYEKPDELVDEIKAFLKGKNL